jgi:hypothetical protein
MTCGICQTAVPEITPIGGLVICPTCLRCIHAESGVPATASDTLALAPEQLAALKGQRKTSRTERPVQAAAPERPVRGGGRR